MAWYEWILSALLFIVALGVEITLHELGHFSMAKLFNVYCHEFSVGFGPALIHKRKEGKETYFSIRAIPLGGYVSMFGEEGQEPEEGLNLPQERSLEGIKKWKKAIIVSAGIIVNTVLSIILIMISDLAFPIIRVSNITTVKENSIAQVAGFENDERIYFYSRSDDIQELFNYEYTDSEKTIHAGQFAIIDPNVEMIPPGGTENEHFVLTYSFSGTRDVNSLEKGLSLYRAAETTTEIVEGIETIKFTNEHVQDMFGSWVNKSGSPTYYPDFTLGAYGKDLDFSCTVTLQTFKNDITVKTPLSLDLTSNHGKWNEIGLSFKTFEEWLPFEQRFENVWYDFGEASMAVFKGLGVLFSGGIQNMSGVVGMFTTSASLMSNYTFSTYLYFWGMISINLAIFNLLPFPGLDGWQLLVTAIEGISKKKLPSKFKAIMSYIGLGLLFVLMAVILFIDVRRIIGL